jgi:hypothetical protein
MQQFTSAIRFPTFDVYHGPSQKAATEIHEKRLRMVKIFSETAAKCKRWESDFALNENWSGKIFRRCF